MNNDLFSREALKEDLIKFFPTDCLDGIESKTLFNQILTDIENAPTVERPTEKWIVDYQENEDALFKHGWKCPVCETRNTYGMPPYCMYCGAKLEKAEKE